MGKKPVVGLAALSLVSFAVSGCWTTDNQVCQGGSCFGKPAFSSFKDAAAKRQQQQQQLPMQQMQQVQQPQQLPQGWNQNTQNHLGGVPGGLPPAGMNPGGLPPAGMNPGGVMPAGSFKPNTGPHVTDPAFHQTGGHLQGAAVDPVPSGHDHSALPPVTTRARSPMVVEDLPRPIDPPQHVQPTPVPVHQEPIVVTPAMHSVPAPVNDPTTPPPIPGLGKSTGAMTSQPAPLPPPPPAGATRMTNPSGVDVQPVGGIQD